METTNKYDGVLDNFFDIILNDSKIFIKRWDAHEYFVDGHSKPLPTLKELWGIKNFISMKYGLVEINETYESNGYHIVKIMIEKTPIMKNYHIQLNGNDGYGMHIGFEKGVNDLLPLNGSWRVDLCDIPKYFI